jgi:hypothetical protein
MSIELETVIVGRDEWVRARARDDHTNNMEELGSGLYSTVYGGNDTPYVVKIMRGADGGYITYINVAAEIAQDCAYVPKVIRKVLYRLADEEYGPDERPGHSNRDYYAIYLERLQQPCRYNYCNKIPKQTLDRFASRLNSIVYDAYNEPDSFNWDNHKPKHRDLIALLVLVRIEAQKVGGVDSVGLDLHAGNIMKRGRQYVVTDPLA